MLEKLIPCRDDNSRIGDEYKELDVGAHLVVLGRGDRQLRIRTDEIARAGLINGIGLIFRGVVEPRAGALDGLVTSCHAGNRDIEGVLFAGDFIVGGIDTFHHGGGDVVFEERVTGKVGNLSSGCTLGCGKRCDREAQEQERQGSVEG